MKLKFALVAVVMMNSVVWGRGIVEMRLKPLLGKIVTHHDGRPLFGKPIPRPEQPNAGIPYNVRCTGKSGNTSVNIATAEFEGKSALKVSKSQPNVRTAPFFFSIDNRSSKDDEVTYKTTAHVLFAGSGSMKGTLNFDSSSKKGTWTEVVTTFDESKGMTVTKKNVYKVSCEEAQ